MKTLNHLLEIIFRRNIEMACDLTLFFINRDLGDGLTFIEFNVNLDLGEFDHSPRFSIHLNVFNLTIFELDIYNSLHVESDDVIS